MKTGRGLLLKYLTTVLAFLGGRGTKFSTCRTSLEINEQGKKLYEIWTNLNWMSYWTAYREIAVGDCVLARDHLSGQKWQAGTVVQQTSPASFQVQLNDGRNWRRHVDDVLQNTPSSAVTHSSSVEITSDQSTKSVTSPSTETRTPAPEESESVESPSTPTPPTSAPRRSKHATKPPLIEEMD